MIIEVKELVVNYGDVKAVDELTFFVKNNEIFGIIGPNGAGKTTTIECIEGLRKPTSGSINILGLNPAQRRKELYELIGVQLQESSYPDKIKVWELCKLFSSFYKKPLSYDKLLNDFGLYDKTNAYVSDLSGGQKQKLSIILSLIPKPKIVFLDELTTGLDPQARHSMWDLIKSLKNEGVTVFMTSHFMDEVENLCDRVAIMLKGKIVALDTVVNHINSSGLEDKIVFTSRDFQVDRFNAIDGIKKIEKDGGKISIFGTGRSFLNNVMSVLQKENINYSDLMIKKPNLEDVFLNITGRDMKGWEE